MVVIIADGRSIFCFCKCPFVASIRGKFQSMHKSSRFRLLLLFLFSAAVTAVSGATGACAGAASAVGATNALFTALFAAVNSERRKSRNHQQDANE